MPDPRRRHLSQAEVEWGIEDLSDRLEDQTREFAALCEEVAKADDDWNRSLWRAQVTLAAQSDGGGRNDTIRRARASQVADGLQGEGRYLRYRLAQERQRSMQAAMRSTQAKLDALRSLNSNLRPQVSGR